MPRPRRADLCLAPVDVKDQTYRCRRKRGHTGPHKDGAVRWEDVRRIDHGVLRLGRRA